MDDISAPQGQSRSSATAPSSRRTSQMLRDFLSSHTEPRISLGALRDALDDRGFGVLLFIFALPNLVPVNIPLLSAVLGLPLVLLAAQLSYGRHKPWFPDWLTSQSFPREGFVAVVNRALPFLERVERLLRPRLTVLLSWTGERLVGVAILILAIILTLPIPFANWLPAWRHRPFRAGDRRKGRPCGSGRGRPRDRQRDRGGDRGHRPHQSVPVFLGKDGRLITRRRRASALG